MKKLTGILTVLFGLTASAVGTVSYHDSLSKVESLIKSNQWEQLASKDLIVELRQLSEDDRFRMANALEKDGVFGAKLFFDSKHKIGKIQDEIRSGKLSQKDLALYKLSLFLRSDLEAN